MEFKFSNRPHLRALSYGILALEVQDIVPERSEITFAIRFFDKKDYDSEATKQAMLTMTLPPNLPFMVRLCEDGDIQFGYRREDEQAVIQFLQEHEEDVADTVKQFMLRTVNSAIEQLAPVTTVN